MSTCGLDWVVEVEGQWRKLYQGSNSIELHLESRKAGGCLTFLLHLTECSTETRRKEKERRERANKVCFKTFFICSQRREREKRERGENSNVQIKDKVKTRTSKLPFDQNW